MSPIQGNPPFQAPGGYEQRLEMLPMIPRAGTPGDGTEPKSPKDMAEQPGSPVQEAPPPPPTLEDCDPQTAYRTIDMLVRSQERLVRNRWAVDLHFRRLDANIPFSRLTKIPNQSVWEAKLPPGTTKESPAAIPNKAHDLCDKVVDTIEADPAKPDPVTPTDSVAAEAAGELASQFLRQLDSSTGLDSNDHWRWSLRNALTAGSSFTEYDLDMDGGGWQPYQVLAMPGATDPENPMVALDPATGLPLPPVNPILRYVSADNQFVEDASQADRVWLPGIRINRLRREQVRVFPAHVPVEDARAVILLKSCTLQEALEMEGWDDVRAMSPGELAQLATFRTPYPQMIAPPCLLGGQADGMSGPGMGEVGYLSPLLQRRMYYYRLYVKAGKTEYQNGLRLDISGANGGTILCRETLDYQVTLPGQEGKVSRCRSIPVVQETPEPDIHGLDPMGWPFEARFAGSSEATATLLAGYLDALDQRNHPHVFLRTNAAVDEDDWADRSVPILLGAQDQEPTYERFPNLPDIIGPVEFLYRADDSAASLGETAQGLNTDTAVSGIAKQITVQQARIGLSGIQQRHNACKVRGWKICLEIAQAKFSTARMIRFAGEDSSAQVQWWTGDDLAGIDDLGITPGTGTMMTPEGKASYVAYLQGQQWLSAADAGPIALSGITRDLGLPPDPIQLAIERSVDAWRAGPPDGWLEAWQQQQQQVQAFQAQQQQYAAIAQQAQMQGVQPPPPPQQPQLPPLPTPFIPRPNDAEPAVAQQWVKALSRVQMSPAYSALPDPWRALGDQKYQASLQTVSGAQQQQPLQQAVAQLVPKIQQLVVSDLAGMVAKEATGQITGQPQQPSPGQPMVGKPQLVRQG